MESQDKVTDKPFIKKNILIISLSVISVILLVVVGVLGAILLQSNNRADNSISNRDNQNSTSNNNNTYIPPVSPSGNNNSSNTPSGVQIFDQKCDPNDPVKFTSDLVNFNQVKTIIPSGVAAGEDIKAHSYIRLSGKRADVYAPADMYFVQGAYYFEPSIFEAKTTYVMHFIVSCNLFIFLDHITDPVDKIRNALNQTPQQNTAMNSFTSEQIFFKKGELIGTTIGAGTPSGIKSFDFGLYDKRVKNKFINQQRYETIYDWKNNHAVCGYDYFADNLKQRYFEKFATLDDRIVPGAPCRSPYQDKEGTAAGKWFMNQTDPSIAKVLALAVDLDGKLINITGIGNNHFAIRNNEPSFKDPATITTQHCFQDSSSNRYIFVKVTSNTEMRAYESQGRCPASFEESKARTYYR